MASSGANLNPKPLLAGGASSDGTSDNAWSTKGGAHIVKKFADSGSVESKSTKSNTKTNALPLQNRKTFNVSLTRARDATTKIGRTLVLGDVDGKESSRLNAILEREGVAKIAKMPVWKVTLKGKASPTAESLRSWSDAIIKGAKDVIEDTHGIEITTAADEFEVT